MQFRFKNRSEFQKMWSSRRLSRILIPPGNSKGLIKKKLLNYRLRISSKRVINRSQSLNLRCRELIAKSQINSNINIVNLWNHKWKISKSLLLCRLLNHLRGRFFLLSLNVRKSRRSSTCRIRVTTRGYPKSLFRQLHQAVSTYSNGTSRQLEFTAKKPSLNKRRITMQVSLSLTRWSQSKFLKREQSRRLLK
jgi:hypothetical protein